MALWFRIANYRDVSQGHLFIHSLAQLTHLLAPHCSLRSLTPELVGKRFLFMIYASISYSFNPLRNVPNLTDIGKRPNWRSRGQLPFPVWAKRYMTRAICWALAFLGFSCFITHAMSFLDGCNQIHPFSNFFSTFFLTSFCNSSDHLNLAVF